MKTTCTVLLCFMALSLFAADDEPAKPAPTGRKVEKPPNFIPTKADPLMGDWQGDKTGYVAQVVPTGDGQYKANVLTAFDTENNLVTTLQGVGSGDSVTFSGNGWTA